MMTNNKVLNTRLRLFIKGILEGLSVFDTSPKVIDSRLLYKIEKNSDSENLNWIEEDDSIELVEPSKGNLDSATAENN